MAKELKAEMSFLEHLEVLRWHLVRSLVAILVVAIIAFVFKSIVFDVIIIAPKTPEFPTNRLLCMLGQELNIQKLCINSQPFELQTVKMAEQFQMHIIIRPAMHDKEKKTASGAVFFTSILFILGVAFGYYLIAPLSVHFLGNYKVSEEVISNPTLGSYVRTVTSVVLAAGIVFELPVMVYFLSKIGIITPDFLKKYRRHSLVLILALSALITPPDIFSQIMVSLPLIILYEIGIGISRRIMKERDQKEAATAK
jgi:sec-independent protein translocase protein TatC